jgi:RNA polymerase sigma factor (sigma-70 family)
VNAPFTDRTDAQLVAGVLAGDREAFAAVYDRYADRLHDFCHSVLRDRDEAADAVQDTFVLAAQRLAQLDDPERLRPWLYAVARSVALRRVRARRRVVLDEVEDMADSDPGPHRAAERAALRDLVWSAAAGLSDRDRALLDLHVRQGLDGAELGEAMGVPAGHAYVLLSRLRDQVERSLGALLIARLGREDCTELDGLLAGWDGKFSPVLRKRVARHVDGCAVCGDRRRIMVSPFALLASVPLLPAPPWLRDRVLDEVQLVAHTTTGAPAPVLLPVAVGAGAGTGQSAPSTRQRRVLAAAAAVLVLLALLGVTAYFRADPVPGEPIALDVPVGPSTTSAPTSTPAPSRPPSSTSSSPPTTTTEPTEVTPEEEEPPPPPVVTDSPESPPPPDPPDPPGDRTAPVVAGVEAGDPRLYVANCWPPTQTSVSAAASDDVGVVSVVLGWSGPDGSGSRPMSQDGDRWYGTLGTFAQSGTVSWSVTATDAAGNTSAPAGGTTGVDNCIG